MKENINALTLGELHADGMVTVSPSTVLDEKIPYDIIYGDEAEAQKEIFGGAEFVGDLRMNDLLNLTLAMISKLG